MGVVDWIDLIQDVDKWQAVMNTVMNLSKQNNKYAQLSPIICLLMSLEPLHVVRVDAVDRRSVLCKYQCQ
jgi:hypothetical protein